MEREKEYEKILKFMGLLERLKCNTRHSWTSTNRRESVAEHSYRLCVLAWLLSNQFPECNQEKLIKMCLFHDLGEAVTGDIPSFEKQEEDIQREKEAIQKVLEEMLEGEQRKEVQDLFEEIEGKKTLESRLFHALDKIEAVIQHNEASVETWLPLEHELQLIYGEEEAEAFPYLREFRKKLKKDSLKKLKESKEV